MENTKPQRRYDLDWLRIFIILAVFVFHSGRFFDMDDWHIKNPETYMGAQVWSTFMVNWLMPFVFIISGASLFFALNRRGTLKFIDDKIRRLFVPLIVGIFSHIILQVYLERLTHRQFSGSFWEFIPQYFKGWYGFGGNFAWMGLHLWYLLVLFVFTLLCYPLFYWLKSAAGSKLLSGLGKFLALPGAEYLLALPVAWLVVELNPRGMLGMRSFGGWPLPVYLLFFIYGFIVMAHEGLQARIQQFRWISLAAGLACVVTLILMWAERGDPAFGTSRYLQIFGLFGISSWCWILAFLGFGFKHFTRSMPILTYATEAVLPFYVLHQTVLLCIGYFVTRWHLPDAVKFVAISSSSFIVIMVVYEFLVRRSNLLRFLFGMKPKKKSQLPAVSSAGLARADG